MNRPEKTGIGPTMAYGCDDKQDVYFSPKNGGVQIPVKWTVHADKVFQCHIVLLQEEDGRFSVYSATLPGVVSYGDTEEEAVENIRDALKVTIESYLDSPSGEIPWSEFAEELPSKAKELWILVHV